MNQLVTRGCAMKFEVGDKLLNTHIKNTKYSHDFEFLIYNMCVTTNTDKFVWGNFLSELYMKMFDDFCCDSFIGFKCFNKFYKRKHLEYCFTYVVVEYNKSRRTDYKLTPEVYSGIFQETPSK